jgi:hypothetical protein
MTCSILPDTTPSSLQKPHLNRGSDDFQQLNSPQEPQHAKLSARQPGQPVYSGLRSKVPDSGSIVGELDWLSEISVAHVRYQLSPENSNSEIIVMGDREHFMSTHVLRGRSGI